MKSFKDYLIESIEEKKYSFKIKIAGDLPEHIEDTMKVALEKYQVANFSKGKTTPIQSKLSDFPTLENTNMTIFDVDLMYPTTSQVLCAYMAEQTGVDHGYIRVRSLSEEEENEINNEHLDEETEKALLGQDYTKESNQSMVGDQGISNFLKDIAKQNKQSQPTQYKGVNDKLLAKSAPKEKTPAQAKLAASHSPISGTSKGKVK
jgi:uncharacterized protein YwqG